MRNINIIILTELGIAFLILAAEVTFLFCKQRKRQSTSPLGLFIDNNEIFYQSLQDDLRFFKTQQWLTTYYSLLILAVSFFLGRIDGISIILRFLLLFVTLLFIDFGIYLVLELQFALRNTRRHLARTHLDRRYYRTTADYNKQLIKDSKFFRDCKFMIAFAFTCILGVYILLVGLFPHLYYQLELCLSNINLLLRL